MHFKSITTRIVFLHIVAIVLTAILMPLTLFWLLNSEINSLHRATMQDQAKILASNISRTPDGTLRLELPDSLKDLYSEAYGRYSYDVIDQTGAVLFSSHKDRIPIFQHHAVSKNVSFFEGVRGDSLISGASIPKIIEGKTVWIRVAEDLTHRDVITDDIIANFFRRVGWIVIPILLLLLATDILIFRRAVAPLLRASKQAETIGPTRTDVRLPIERIPNEILPLVTAVNLAFDRLEDGFRVQRQFTADAAHELRTPLAILRTRIDTLDQGIMTRDLLRDIEGMSRIVGQLLEIAELDTLEVDASETADLCSVCSEVIVSIAPLALADHKNIALKSPDDAVIVRGSAQMLQRAIRNLVENAIRHTKSGTVVEIEIMQNGSVFVRDEGPGIPPDKHELIFQRFWRGERQGVTGAGLGLSIVRGVIEDCGGTITVENTATAGAQFHLRFQKPVSEHSS